jgi:ribonuclease VapC
MNRDQVQLARETYVKFGKDYHPAALNLGDCCSYALARISGEPLFVQKRGFPENRYSFRSLRNIYG